MKDFSELLAKAKALAEDNPWPISAFANLSSLIYNELEDVSWAGFYLAESYIKSTEAQDSDRLLLGPFCGKPACIVIPFGKGVCGTAAAAKETIAVKDIELFPGHIACDEGSRSEIVVPVIKADKVIGVLDIDSYRTGRFGDDEKILLEAVVRMLEKEL